VHKKGHIARNCGKLPLSVGEARVTDTSVNRLPGQPEVDVPQKGCRIERRRYAYRGTLHPVSIIYGDSV